MMLPMIIAIQNTNLTLEKIEEKHIFPLYELANRNKAHLRPWLGWVDYMKDISFMEKFVARTIKNQNAGTELAFVIVEDEKLVGRIGLYKIDDYNKSAEIGYWIDKTEEGKGITTMACRQLCDYAFTHIKMHRLEIRCAVNNEASKKLPTRLGFKKEGTLAGAEYLNGKFVDLEVFGLVSQVSPM